ncbi:MAG TPA: hypothetical protein VNP92_12135 [Actinophytocola sp.]|nr:hypothetical protein [Actinophytocola sp.]
MLTPQHRSHSQALYVPRAAAIFGFMLILALSLGIAPAPMLFGQADQAFAAAVAPKRAPTPIQRADNALHRAVVTFRAHRYREARAWLTAVRRNVKLANQRAAGLIGAPPTDPESDDPPGPAAVLRVLALEHRVGMAVVPLFNGTTAPRNVDALRLTLWSSEYRRNIILGRVIALPPEGAGADYADGMGDTLGTYAGEVRLITTALNSFQLTSSGRVSLGNALARVRATQAAVTRAFGEE